MSETVNSSFLLVGYTPSKRMLRQKPATSVQFKRGLKKLKISEPKPWDVIPADKTIHTLTPKVDADGKETGSWFGLRDNEIYSINPPIEVGRLDVVTTGHTLTTTEFESGLLASATYDENTIVACGWGSPLMILDVKAGFNILYRSEQTYRYQNDYPSLWCNFSRCLALHKPYVYMVARDTNHVIRFNIPELKRLNPGNSAVRTYNVQASEICVDGTGLLYSITKKGRIDREGAFFHQIADPSSQVWNGLTHNKRQGRHGYILAAGSSTGQVVLIDKFGIERSRASVNSHTGYTEIMRIHTFTLGKLEFAVLGKEYHSMSLVAIHRHQIHVVKANLGLEKDNHQDYFTSGEQKLISGIFLREQTACGHRREIIVSRSGGLSSFIFSL